MKQNVTFFLYTIHGIISVMGTQPGDTLAMHIFFLFCSPKVKTYPFLFVGFVSNFLFLFIVDVFLGIKSRMQYQRGLHNHDKIGSYAC